MIGATFPLVFSALILAGSPEPPARYGYLNQRAYCADKALRLPLTAYCPQPGDVVIYSDTNIAWSVMYAIALTGPPGHSGLVMRMDDGILGVMEAGFDDKPRTHVAPFDDRLRGYKGTIWIRQRKAPICAAQSCVLTEFGNAIEGHRYAVGRLLGQLTPLRSRGPLRTVVLGKPKGIRSKFTCSEAVLEGLVLAGLVDAETTRPSATYPRDLFYDRSPNLYINRHPPLVDGWEVPALWVRGACSLESGGRIQEESMLTK